MKRYHSEGGMSNPNFRHKVKVKDSTDAMFNWCSTNISEASDFDRYYVQWLQGGGTIFQFENERPALVFALKFGHL
jgi:hypothetical protein